MGTSRSWGWAGDAADCGSELPHATEKFSVIAAPGCRISLAHTHRHLMNHPSRRILAASLFAALTASAGAFILPVEQDSSSNARGTLSIASGAATTLPVNAKQTALIRFNVGGLQGVVPAASVSAARLRIYFSSVVKPGDIEVHKVLGTWSETAAGTLPIVDPMASVIPAADVVKKQFIVIDVTNTVKGWLATGGDFGFAFSTASTTAKVLLGSKEGAATGYPAELELDIAQVNVDGATLGGGTVTDAKLAGGISASKLGGGTISNTEFGFLDGASSNLQNQLDGKAPFSHTHDASDIISGLLSDVRLSSNIPRLSVTNTFANPLGVTTINQNVLNLTSNAVGGSWINLTNTSNASARSYNLLSTGSANGEGPGKLLVRDNTAGLVRLTVDTDGDVGIGTTSPSAKLEIQTDAQKSLKFRQDGVAIGIEGVSNQAGDIYAGYLRLRSNVEVWPPVDGSHASSLDIRNAAGNPTVSFDGSNGKIAAANLPAAKLAKTVRDPRTAADDLVVNTNSAVDLDNISVNIPSDGMLIIRATANVNLIAKAGTVGECFYTLYEMTSGSPVKLTEMHAQVSRESAGGVDTFQGGSPTLTWTLPCSAGTRSFRTSLNTTINSSAFIDTTTLLVEYVPNSL